MHGAFTIVEAPLLKITQFFVPVMLGVATISGASAADLSYDFPQLVEMPGDSFDWSGFYAGVYAGVQDSATGGTQFGAGVNAGVNAQFDFYLLGAEVAVHGLTDAGAGETSYGQILGRAGLVATDDVMIYAAGGYGMDLGPPSEEDILAGGGVELAVTDSVSVRAQYLHGFPVAGGEPKNQFTFGANIHF